MASEFNYFNRYAGALMKAQGQVDVRSAKRMRARAAAYAASHRDTGAETEGVYVKSWTGYNEGPKAIGKAEDLNPKSRMFDEVPEPPIGETLIVAETPYDVFQEYGRRGASAHPFMTPAFYDEMSKNAAEAKGRALERELKKLVPPPTL